MKTLFTAIVLIIGFSAIAQTEQITPYGIGYGIAMPETLQTIRAIVPVIGDTAIVSDTSIHFIKIGGQVFEIKRSVTIEPAKPGLLLKNGLVVPYGFFGTGTIGTTGVPFNTHAVLPLPDAKSIIYTGK